MDDRLRVLIVEDEFMLAMALEALLEDEGHVVVGLASSSSEAISMADAEKPNLVFVDMHLSDGPTGLRIARHLRHMEGTGAVFVTANASRLPPDYEGAMGVIAKPYSQRGVLAVIRYLDECVRRPPPVLARPFEFTIAPAYEAILQSLG